MKVSSKAGFFCAFFACLVSAPAANYVVTSLQGYATGGLNQVIIEANASPGPHTITFDPAILPATIEADSQTIDCDLTISGPGADLLKIDFGVYNNGFVIPAGRTVSISGVTIQNATAFGQSGASGVYPANPTPGSGGQGGGIQNSGALTVTDCVFSNCKAIGGEGGSGAYQTNQFGMAGGSGRGGAIFSDGTSLTVIRCLFVGNEARGGYGGNGATYTQVGGLGGGGGNGGFGSGGGIYVASGSFSVVSTTFASQMAAGGAGGAGGQAANLGYNSGGTGGNASGGAIFSEVTASITHTTVAFSQSRSGTGGSSGFSGVRTPGAVSGGGIEAAGVVTLGNSLIAGNLVGVGFAASSASDLAGSFSSLGFNLIGALDPNVAGFSGATELTGTPGAPLDARLASQPASNGAAVGTLRLLPGSPAVDKGSAINGATVDQRGQPRTLNLPDQDFPDAVGGDGTDIGAFESQAAPNAQPVAFSTGYLTGTQGVALSGVMLGGYDPDSEPVTFLIVGTPLPAGLTLNGNGSITGTPEGASQGTYQFKVNDGKEDSEVVSFDLAISESASLVVNSLSTSNSPFDGVTTLVEAIALAQTDGLTTPVTFDPTVFASRESIVVISSLQVSNDLEIVAPTAGVILSGPSSNPLLALTGGNVSISRVTFSGDAAGYVTVSGTANATFTGCTMGGGLLQAAAITNSGGTLNLLNCTIAEADIRYASVSTSAISQSAGTTLIQNCTIAGNVGTNAIDVAGGTLSIGNSIVAGNTVTDGGPAMQIFGTVTSLGYNLIGPSALLVVSGTTTGNQLNVADPLVAPDLLDFNGGPTPTVALLPASPAVDKGKAMGSVTADQRGRLRPFDVSSIASASGGDGSDIGAFEVQAPEPEIALQYNGGTELSVGSTIHLGQSEVGIVNSIVISIVNKGTSALALSGTPRVALSGESASSYSIEQQPPASIAGGASTTFLLNYWPQSPGTKPATLTIASNDSDEAAFVINLTGSAVDSYAVAPELLAPANNGFLYPMANVVFKLPEPAQAGSVKVSFQLMDFPFTQTTIDYPGITDAGIHSVEIDTVTLAMGNGPFYVSIGYKDATGADSGAGVQGVTIRPNSATTALRLGVNSAAPGAGIVQGLPGNATITAFNQPAIDDNGNIVYLAKWASASPKLSGTGFFVNNSCAAVTGSYTSLGGNITYSSFTDPVIDSSQFVSIAGLKGGTPKPPAAAVVTGLTTQNPPGLSVLTTLGLVAPDAGGNTSAGGPVFKTFHAVDIRAGVIGIYAQLAGGEGANKVSASNDNGLWLKNGNGPLRLALREGQTVGNKTISNLLVFTPGELSGGQGRGWLAKPAGTGGAVLALATFTDKTQAVVSAEAGGVAELFSSTGALGTDGGPDTTGVSFVTYGFPAANDNDTNAFAALLKIGAGGVGKADARGIFLSHPNGSYTTIARIGQPSGVDGSSFSALRDPVLSPEDGLAFLATLKGGTVSTKAGSSIWWKPAGRPLALLARAGGDAADISGAKWNTFTNLAIAGGGRGPVFIATLASGPGGVSSANDTGVWACDFIGQPRLLFREGDTIGGKRLTGFQLLTGVKGSLGVSRSLNDRFQVAWVAVFSDKTTAIMVTEVP